MVKSMVVLVVLYVCGSWTIKKAEMRWLDGITNSMDMSWSNVRVLVMNRKVWRADVHGVAKSRSLRILNSSARIPPHQLALFVVMLPKVYLTLHSRMSGSWWMTTPSGLSKSLDLFLYSSFVYSCHLFLISSASVRSLQLLSLLCPSLHEIFPWYLWGCHG